MDGTISTTFERLIEKREERQYLRVPFQVTEGIETLTIAISYTRHRVISEGEGKTLRPEVNIIDLALEDPDHVLVGASGSERREITIHENHATPGYHSLPLRAGTWFIILGAYHIEEEGCPVLLTVTQIPKDGILLKGDCHTHTVHSDGWYTVDELISRVRTDRLDYLFVTDHNAMTSNELLRSYPDLTVLPGVEITYYDGHCNMFGVKRPVKTYVANGREEVLAVLREGRENGALLSLNHPFDPGCGWQYGIGGDVPLDMVEIWNGPFTLFNQQAIDMWHKELTRGRIWPAVGGSDCHHMELFRTFAAPATCLYAASRSGSDILDAMKTGHAYIGMNMGAPGIYLAMGEARMGDVYRGAREPLQLRVDSLRAGDEIRLLNQDSVLWKNKPGACYQYETDIKIKDSLFVRAEVRRLLPGVGETLASVSNPIYLR